jgi:two-component system response regulator (stage 0 sporulation protein F)
MRTWKVSITEERAPTVLVVDDEPEVRMVLELVLRAEGFEVESAASGQEALMRVRAETFDVLVLDLAMPGLTGLEVARELAADEHRVPTIVFSALLDHLVLAECEELGVDAVDKLDWPCLVERCRELALGLVAAPTPFAPRVPLAAPERARSARSG